MDDGREGVPDLRDVGRAETGSRRKATAIS
jgi:hypothetical protein